MSQWRPQSTGNQIADRNFSVLCDMVSTALGKLANVNGAQSQALTGAQIKALVDPRNLVKEFEASGSAPLDLTGLLGVTGSAQIAGIPILSAIPTANDPHFINTAAIVVGGQLYVNFNGTFTGTTVGLTSVAIAVPAGFAVAGSPLTSNGTITISISDAATVRADIGAVALSDTNVWSALNTFSKTIVGTRQTYTGIIGTTTFDLSLGNVVEFTFAAGNETIALSNIKDGTFYSIDMIQDAGGSRTATWPATVKWVAGTPPTLSTGANQRDTFFFHSNGTNLYELARRGNVS